MAGGQDTDDSGAAEQKPRSRSRRLRARRREAGDDEETAALIGDAVADRSDESDGRPSAGEGRARLAPLRLGHRSRERIAGRDEDSDSEGADVQSKASEDRSPGRSHGRAGRPHRFARRHKREEGAGDSEEDTTESGGSKVSEGEAAAPSRKARARRGQARRRRDGAPAPPSDDESAGSEAISAGDGSDSGDLRADDDGESGSAGAAEHAVDLGPFRRAPTAELEARHRLRERVEAELAPEVHFIGEVRAAAGDFSAMLGLEVSGVFVKWMVEAGKYWSHLAGEQIGQTQVSYAEDAGGVRPLNHPLDLHYTACSMQGWPRLLCQVWTLDAFGRANVAGYGFGHLPLLPGQHTLEVPCWRPTGSLREETEALFLGNTTQLTTDDVLFGAAWDARWRLVTAPAGTVVADVCVLTRHFAEQDIDAA